MKKRILLLMALMISITFVMAQTDFVYPELISKDSVELLTVHNGQLITGKKDKKRNIYLAVNNKVDTLKLNSPFTYWEIIPVHYNTENSIYIEFTYRNNKSQLIGSVYKLDLDTKIFTEIKIGEFRNIYCIINDIIVLSGKNDDDNVYGYNLKKKSLDSLFYGGESYFVATNFLIDYQTLIGYYESGSIENFALYDFSNNQLTYHIEQLDTFSYYDKGKINTYFRDITEKYYNVGLFWVDEDFNKIQPTLPPYRQSYSSYNLSGTASQFCYRPSYIERNPNSNYVWVICKFSLSFDKALYDIYNNVLIDKTEVETFDEWELNKLRNMVFAKHGYQFKSEYLQAFFNLFDFYNNITKTVDVTNSLTPIDKKNLELIQQVSKQK